jgi:hypothetical protein
VPQFENGKFKLGHYPIFGSGAVRFPQRIAQLVLAAVLAFTSLTAGGILGPTYMSITSLPPSLTPSTLTPCDSRAALTDSANLRRLTGLVYSSGDLGSSPPTGPIYITQTPSVTFAPQNELPTPIVWSIPALAAHRLAARLKSWAYRNASQSWDEEVTVTRAAYFLGNIGQMASPCAFVSRLSCIFDWSSAAAFRNLAASFSLFAARSLASPAARFASEASCMTAASSSWPMRIDTKSPVKPSISTRAEIFSTLFFKHLSLIQSVRSATDSPATPTRTTNADAYAHRSPVVREASQKNNAIKNIGSGIRQSFL